LRSFVSVKKDLLNFLLFRLYKTFKHVRKLVHMHKELTPYAEHTHKGLMHMLTNHHAHKKSNDAYLPQKYK
jgi:hypothetical protein